MGIIGCEVDYNYKQKEMKKEVKINEDEDYLKKLYIEYKSKFPEMMSETEFINQYKSKYYSTKNKNYENNKSLHELNPEKKIDKKILNEKINKKQNLNQDEINEKSNNDLIIITPRNNVIKDNSYNNEITDEFTIKNESMVYNINNSKDKLKYSQNLKDIKEEYNKDDKNKDNNKNNNNNNKRKININGYSKSFISKKKINAILNLNSQIEKPKEKNEITEYQVNNKQNNSKQKSKSNTNKNNKILKKKIIRNNNKFENINIINNNINNHNHNKSYNNKKNYNIPPLQDSFLFSNNIENYQASTLENQNIQLRNILLQQLPLFQKEEIIPKIERKTYQEDLIGFKEKIKNNNILLSEPKKSSALNRQKFNQLYDKHNNYLFVNNNHNCINDNTEIIKKLNNIYQFLSKENDNIIKNNEKKLFKKRKSKSPKHTNNNIPIANKETDFLMIKNYCNNKKPNCNFSTNNDNNNNSFFSLFNNSTNLSINFINKANKSARSRQKILSFLDRHNINENNDNNTDYIGFNNNITNPLFYYNKFNKGDIDIPKKIPFKNYNKDKPLISYSKSYNNMINIIRRKSNSDINKKNQNYNKKPLTQRYRDLIEVYIPKKKEKSLISKEIINNIIGNKYIFNYEKIETFDTDQILYDGTIYKVIDNMEKTNNDETFKYKLVDRYFQITKNCFKYYNNINEAINKKDKPLVQFDIRYIDKLDILDNSILENYKIHGKKNVNIIFCIYLNQNNDFFVFVHDSINVGNNIINILLFLKRFYEKKH